MSWVVRASILLPLTFAVACASTQTVDTEGSSGPSAQDYAPMDVGYSWTYEMLFQGQKGEQTIEVLGFKDGFFQDNQAGELKHTDDGLRDRARYLIKHPLAPGNTWKAIVSASAVERYRIDSVGERCESAAGAFEDCLVVTSQIRRDQDVTLHGKFTWAKGVGAREDGDRGRDQGQAGAADATLADPLQQEGRLEEEDRRGARRLDALMGAVAFVGSAIGCLYRERRIDRERMEAVQSARLAKLLEHAKATTPIWKDRIASADPTKLADIAPVTKSELMARFDDTIANGAITKQEAQDFADDPEQVGRLYKDRFVVATTSGTTGRVGMFVTDADGWSRLNGALMARILRHRLVPHEIIRFCWGRRYRMSMTIATGGHFITNLVST